MNSFSDYKLSASKWITFIEAEHYPDYLDAAKVLYGSVLKQFENLVNTAQNSANLLENISNKKEPERTQLLRVFRRYISPDTSVEMLKRKNQIPNIIEEFGNRFRPIEEVKRNLASRPGSDETIMALLYEYKDRGKKGYELTVTFFTWFDEKFGEDYEIQGPTGAGRDVMLNKVLRDFQHKIPADILISRKDGTPLVIGFARYDSDRGGAQEDDRTGGNRHKVTEIRKYASEHNVPLKIIFINDGPGLLLGSMWNDYAELERYGQGDVMVCTLKMLNERFNKQWLES